MNDVLLAASRAIRCPTCKAHPGTRCQSKAGKRRSSHQKRLDKAGSRMIRRPHW